jgi:hypothetical protein
MRRLAIARGWLGTAARKAHTILSWPQRAVSFPECRASGGRKLAKGAGRLAALTGFTPQPYRVVRGR